MVKKDNAPLESLSLSSDRLTLTLDQLKSHNHNQVLSIIRRDKGLSRRQIADRLGLVPSAMTKIAGQLLKAGLIEQVANEDMRRDQPRSRLYINNDWGYVITLSLTWQLSIGVTDFNGELVYKKHLAGDSPYEFAYKNNFRELVSSELRKVISEWQHKNLIGIGVLSTGDVSKKGIISHNAMLPENNINMTEFLNSITPLPVHTDQELRLLLYNDISKGRFEHKGYIAGINPGVLGQRGRHALLINGAPFYSSNGMLGMPGRLTAIPHRDTAAEMEKKIIETGGVEKFISEILDGKSESLKVYRCAVENYAVRLLYTIFSYDPEMILLYSPYYDIGERFIREVREKALKYCSTEYGSPSSEMVKNIEIKFAGRRKEDEWLTAAALPLINSVSLSSVK
ncbi:MAG: MarR family transcriptional regulator [Planctomycetota bacterium]|jgi:predicted NBD/HSP70 family sugar kinase